MTLTLRYAGRFIMRVLRRFAAEDFTHLSASLAFTTLFSLVPMVAVVFGIASLFPIYYDMVEHLDYFVLRTLLPEGNAVLIINHILEFSQKATNFTLAGSAVLIVTVFSLLLDIERAFNRIWRAGKNRPWWKRLSLYLALIGIWPIAVSLVVFAIYSAVKTSLVMIDDSEWLLGDLLRVAGLLVAALFFSGLYYFVPNARVRWQDAAWAGGFTAVGFGLMQKAFAFYLAHFPSMALIYGAFATVPIFLMWVYFSWAIVIIGALAAAGLPELRRSKRA